MSTPPVIQPVYRTPELDAPIRLFQGSVELRDGERPISIPNCTLDWIWQPKPRMVLRVPAPLVLGTSKVRFPGMHDDSTILVYGRECLPTEPVVLRRSAHIVEADAVKFHLPSFPRYIGSSVTFGQGETACRLSFEYQNWSIAIDAIDRDPELVERAAQSSRYLLTHVGEIRRRDRSRVQSGELHGFLRKLRKLLSFLAGRWTSPVLLVGYRDGEIIWQEFRQTTTDPYDGIGSWWNPQNPAIASIAEPFLRKLDDPTWDMALQRVMWWLFFANRQTAGTDGSLVLAQMALEALAWYANEKVDWKVKRSEFKRMKTRERIRFLLRGCRIPTQIPEEASFLTEALQTSKDETDDKDGPYALVKIRNDLAHAVETSKLLAPRVCMETLKLALTYIELSILYLIGYAGMYRHRCRPAIEEPVPWSEN